ncbi:MAG TPA: Uma2 family endonuclease, partial [Steroidobacteraceae bacterium]
RDEHYHTYGDYLIWSRTFGDEVINGTAYIREPPSASRLHQDIVGELHRQIANTTLNSPWRVYVAPLDVRLPRATEKDEDIDTVVQPDLLIVSNLEQVDRRGVRGAPCWLAEVLSPGTSRYDRRVKLPVYERAGVREVWLVQPLDRTVTVYQLASGQYGPGKRFPLEGKMQLTAVPHVTIDWDLVLSRLSP